MNDDLIDGLEVIARRRGQTINQGDVEMVELVIEALKRRTEAEWRLGSETPRVSGWQWIDYWTPDGLPGCTRYMFGDPWDEGGIACWRFRGTMPPYAAAPNPSTGMVESSHLRVASRGGAVRRWHSNVAVADASVTRQSTR